MIALRPQSADFEKRFRGIIAQAKNPRAILANAGREAGNQLKTHFRLKDRTGANTLAPDRRSHLWNKIAQSVQAPVVSGNAALVNINHPIIAQKVFGGPIIAKRVKALTIPVSPEAYGRSASTFEQETGLQLFVLKKKDAAGGRGGVLAAAEGQGIKVHYILTPRVNQKADPTALPPEPNFSESILRRAAAVLQRQLNGANG
jgi:hypothetical protein